MGTATVFWDVDTQVDFMEPGGKLYVPWAENIVPQLSRLTAWLARNKVLLISSADAHLPDDAEFRDWPPHCIVGTPGQKKISATQLHDQLVIPNRPFDLPSELARYQQVVVEKQHIDVFTNPNIEALLERLPERAEIVLYGVVTEVCVLMAARGLLHHGFQVTLVQDAIQQLDEKNGRAAIDEILRLGARLTTANEMLRSAA
jgi:nicotinamidase/pyrazinamidase